MKLRRHIEANMSGGPKRQHHLAQVIQRNFLEKGSNKLWWYSREKNKYEERTSYGIAHGRNTYTLSGLEGVERYALEHAFSKVEHKAGPALKKLEASENLTQDERNAVAEFVGFQFFRTPTKIKLIQGMRDVSAAAFVQQLADHLSDMSDDEFASYATRIAEKSGNVISLSREKLAESLKNRPPTITSTKEATLDSLVHLGNELAIEYSRRSWVVMHAPRDASFITSSEGVFSSGERSARGTSPSPGVPGTITMFPFSRRAALLIEGGGPLEISHTRVHKSQVRDINDHLATVSSEIYGAPRQLLESIVRRNDLDSTRFALELDDEYITSLLANKIREHSDEIFPHQ